MTAGTIGCRICGSICIQFKVVAASTVAQCASDSVCTRSTQWKRDRRQDTELVHGRGVFNEVRAKQTLLLLRLLVAPSLRAE